MQDAPHQKHPPDIQDGDIQNANGIQEKSLPDHPHTTSLAWIKWLIIILALATIAFLIWWFFPLMQQWLRSAQQPTPSFPTITPLPTRTPRPTSTPTIEPTPTMTSMPPSAYVVADIALLDPPLPGLFNPPIVLNEDKNVIASPDFTHPQWYSSARIAEQLGNIEFPEAYYATFGAGQVAWVMDVPLASGLYEIYVLDTLYSSAGSLDFKVRLGSRDLQPLLGQPRLNYRSSQGENAQYSDLWRSIGVYYLDNNFDILSIYTEWTVRDEFSIVAIDRVLIEPLPASAASMLASLPADRLKYLVDDLNASIDGAELILPVQDALAWGDQFQIATNPNKDIKVTWKLEEALPLGKYEVIAWIPSAHNKAGVTYRVLANDQFLEGEPILINQVNYPGQWVSLKVWDASSPVYGNSVNLSAQMDIKGGTLGDIAIDAIGFIQQD